MLDPVVIERMVVMGYERAKIVESVLDSTLDEHMVHYWLYREQMELLWGDETSSSSIQTGSQNGFTTDIPEQSSETDGKPSGSQSSLVDSVASAGSYDPFGAPFEFEEDGGGTTVQGSAYTMTGSFKSKRRRSSAQSRGSGSGKSEKGAVSSDSGSESFRKKIAELESAVSPFTTIHIFLHFFADLPPLPPFCSNTAGLF